MNFFKRKYYQLLSKYLKSKPNSEVAFTKAQYFLKNERELNLDNPVEFAEKLNWLKFYLYTEDYGDFVDKYEVRKFVEKRIGGNYLVDFIAIYDNVDAIGFQALPNQYALKGTHGSGYNVIVDDKSKIDISQVKKTLNKYLHLNYYDKYKELIYKDVKPRILVEHYLDQSDSENIIDFKFFCIHGEPEYIWVKTFSDGKFRSCYYDLEWNKLQDDSNKKDFLNKSIPKPGNLNELISISKKLSSEFIFVRVDLYSIQDKIYFGELTFFPWAGLKRLTVERLNKELGDLMKLPISTHV
ncbi:teichuronopeptide biosynthesis TupA-like protein [Winogradskyella epiphytica]|uniref:Teichuronopeptide biosynthesis TupA-like protein n=1 Tax=Winogradskyella epiphytica TaxID=262005 RepID=A0A2V4WVN6_9FLAO|nr:ATP-grasp fold amidoligase family protein [Winogradskyella epiphytica]PYE81010.1 teichuronopeptide biosynthesis TupA-like protein [Winogradskyella epiphytica]GGW66194.1 glycosyl transferase [Winogradskyella epiphytica]